MLIVLDSVLDAAQCAELLALLGHATFDDGRATAGWSAALVKRNAQAGPDPAIDMWRERVADTLMRHGLLVIAAHPKRIIGPMFTRYAKGDSYGVHVDEPIMGGVRTDLAFTLFLSAPESYGGGELTIESAAGSEAHKHKAGSLVLYPASTLHSVAEVTRGTRYAAVGWVRSLVRDPARRELLFDLDTARRRLFAEHGKTAEHDLISRCHASLLRMWAED